MSDPIVIAEAEKNGRERVRVSLDQYQGQDLINVRITTRLSEVTGIWVPTKKGISLRVSQLPWLAKALAEAEAQARALGLIGGAA